MSWVEDQINFIIRQGAHRDLGISDHEFFLMVRVMVSRICFESGLNTALDYDGINTKEDVILYLEAIRKKVQD